MSDTPASTGAPAASSAPAAPTPAASTAPTSPSQASQSSPASNTQPQAKADAASEASKEVKKWLLKDGNVSKEITDPEELYKIAQKGFGAERRFQQAAQIQKEAKALLDGLRENPLEVYQELGLDGAKLLEKALASGKASPEIVKLAQEVLSRQLEEEVKSPEQKAIEERDAKIKEYEAREAERAKKEEEAKYQQEVAAMDAKLQVDLKDAFDSAKLPMTPRLLRDVAMVMQDYLEQNNMILDANKALEIATTRMSKEFEQIPDEVLENYLGRGKVKSLIKRELERVKSKKVPTTKVPDTGAKQPDANVEDTRPKFSTRDMKRPF